MKKIIIALGMVLLISNAFAQRTPPPTYSGGDKDDDGGISDDRWFAGGSLALGFGSNTFNVGGNPELGYSVSQWLDAGVTLNLNYTSQRADPYYYYNQDTRYRSFNYGGGVFARVYPVRFLFVQLQPELNWIHYSAKDYANNLSYSNTVSAASLIAGVGYTQRMVGEGSYFLMVGLDLLDNANSPYRDSYTRAQLPIIRAGFDFYFHSRKK
ncbi:MAG TPA: hypothetical protein VG738_03550 [Chitinophagaceae bacterium]|nr:hypothetical protein [Chitinophagaceae bacterium]